MSRRASPGFEVAGMNFIARTTQLAVTLAFAAILTCSGCGKSKSDESTKTKSRDPKSPGKIDSDGKVAGKKTSKTDNTNTAKKTDSEPKKTAPKKTVVAKKKSKSNLPPEKAALERYKELGADLTWNLSKTDVIGIDLQGNDKVRDEDLALLVHFPYLYKLNLVNAENITNDGMKHVAKVPRLKELLIAGTSISDDGIKHLQNMEAFEHVCMDNTKVTDGAMQYIKKWNDVTMLHFIGTNVTDAGLKQLFGLRRIKQMYVGRTKVTKDGIKEIQKTWPRVQLAPRN